MKYLLILAASLAVVCSARTMSLRRENLMSDPNLDVKSKWSIWKANFGKTYPSDLDEQVAFIKFEASEKRINEHNSDSTQSWRMGHNQFSDMTPDEFAQKMTPNSLVREGPLDFADFSDVEVTADSLDWTTKGAVTPVKNQGQCGSCWAFSTTGAMEGAFQIATGDLESFSEQELVSCDNSFHGGSDQGCNGGLMDNAFKWIKSHGLCLDSSYPYTSGTGTTGTCEGGMSGPSCTAFATLTGHKDVASESDLLNAVNVGPVSVAIEADKTVFQHYDSGVIDSAFCGKQLDHGVLIVGYGTDSTTGKDYWKIKNSWDSTWGESGFVRIVRDKDMCGIADGPPSYPVGVGKATIDDFIPEVSGVQFDRTVDSISKATGKVTFDKGCTKSDDYGSDGCTFGWGDTVNVNYDLSLEEDIDTGATIAIDAKVDGLLPFKASCAACGANCTLTIPVIKKTVSFAMPDCPIKAAELKNATSFTLPDKSPIGLGVSATGTVTATDQSGTVVAKIEFDAKIGN